MDKVNKRIALNRFFFLNILIERLIWAIQKYDRIRAFLRKLLNRLAVKPPKPRVTHMQNRFQEGTAP